MRIMRNEHGITKKAPIGFSWTTFFFGMLVPVTRGDWKYFLIMTGVAIVTGGLSWLVFPFIYNKMYYEELLTNGYERV